MREQVQRLRQAVARRRERRARRRDDRRALRRVAGWLSLALAFLCLVAGVVTVSGATLGVAGRLGGFLQSGSRPPLLLPLVCLVFLLVVASALRRPRGPAQPR